MGDDIERGAHSKEQVWSRKPGGCLLFVVEHQHCELSDFRVNLPEMREHLLCRSINDLSQRMLFTSECLEFFGMHLTSANRCDMYNLDLTRDEGEE